MSDGLGAAFGSLVLLAVLVGLALLLALTATGALFARRSRGRVPDLARYLATALLSVVLAVTGLAVLALADEAPAFVPLFVALVALPLALVAARGRLQRAGWLDVAATAAMAWSLPFVATVALPFALVAHAGTTTGVATAVGGVVAAAGTLLAGEFLRGPLTADSAARR
jgi:hypothetical protein